MLTLILPLLRAQQAAPPTPTAPPKPPDAPKPLVEETPTVTKHELRAGGKTLNYTATTGMMPSKSHQGEIEANLFYASYTLDRPTAPPNPPLFLAFTGRPRPPSLRPPLASPPP